MNKLNEDITKYNNCNIINKQTPIGVELYYVYPKNEYFKKEFKHIVDKNYIAVKNQHLKHSEEEDSKNYNPICYLIFDPNELSKDPKGIYFAMQEHFFDNKISSIIKEDNKNIELTINKDEYIESSIAGFISLLNICRYNYCIDKNKIIVHDLDKKIIKTLIKKP